MNEPNFQADIDRGVEARAILDAKVFIQARESIESQLKALRSSVPIRDTDMHTRLILMEQLWGMLIGHLEGAMNNADFARMQLKVRESSFERVKQAMMQGLRL